MGRSSSMRDSAEISGTSMNRSTEERWKSVALVRGLDKRDGGICGRTNRKAESFPLTMTRWRSR